MWYGYNTFRYDDRPKGKNMIAQLKTIQTPSYAISTTPQALMRGIALFEGVLTDEQVFAYVKNARTISSEVLIPIPNEVDARRIASALALGYTRPSDYEGGVGKTKEAEKPKRRVIEVPSMSQWDTYYDVVVEGKQPVSCTCRSFTIQGNDPCKHMQAVLNNPRRYGL